MKGLLLFLVSLFVSGLAQNVSAEIDGQWWKHTIIYQILPFSYKDSNGDGIGDIKGIISKLDYLEEMGIETVHLTPVFTTQLRDMGYDIYDYYGIDPRFGTMADFEELVREMKKRNMKLILDLVINHSSHKHIWFRKSVRKIKPYSDFYIWKDPKDYDQITGKPIPPNNWVSVFSGQPGSAWTWNEKRKQFYFHQFLPEQVDFDLRNKLVRRQLKKIIKFWLDKGVAGFRLDAAIFFIEDEYFRDDNHQIRQYNQEENYEFIHELRTFLDKYNEKHGGFERIFIAEAHSDPHIVRKFYDREGYNVTHFPYTFYLRYIDSEITAYRLRDIIEPWLHQLPNNAVSAWMTQDHDGHRVGSRIRSEYMDLLTTISMLLPGNVGVYYGQEIGMMDGSIEQHQIKDHSGGGSRDPARLIMQWDDSKNAGFSTNDQPFLPPNSDYLHRNVKRQKQQPGSHYQLFKRLSELRKSDVFKYGDFESHIPSEYLYIFTRSYQGEKLVVLINLGPQSFYIDLHNVIPTPRNTVFVASSSVNSRCGEGIELPKNKVENFFLRPFSSVVLQAYQRQHDDQWSTTTVDWWYTHSEDSSYDENDSDESYYG